MTVSTQTKTHRILIIDDNEAIHRDFQKILALSCLDLNLDQLDRDFFGDDRREEEVVDTPANYKLSFASQGKDGVEVLKRSLAQGNRFQMAFVDMRMPPGWDGVTTIEHLWEHDPDLQVVICTAYSDKTWDEISQRLKCPENLLILKKPFDNIEVLQMVDSQCRKWELQQHDRIQLESLEEELEQHRTQLRDVHEDAEHLLKAMDGILISLDDGLRVRRWNQAACNAFEIEPEDACGRQLQELGIRWEDASRLTQMFQSTENHFSSNEELYFVDSCGTRRNLEVRVCAIHHDEENSGWLFLATDVTQQKMLRAQLDQAQRLEAVGQLAAGVAHEINTPMQYIGDNLRYVCRHVEKLRPVLEWLPRALNEEPTAELVADLTSSLDGSITPRKIEGMLEQISSALDDAMNGVTNVSQIVAAMKEFSHPGTVEKSLVSMNHLLESTVTVAKNEWKYVADVETRFDDELPSVLAYPGELNQAFLNIMVNACHALADRVKRNDFDRGRIEIVTEYDADSVSIHIKDNGGGIPQEVQERVFEPFFTTKEVGKGTGQGLAIAYNVITKKHNGKIWFDVEPGDGTEFHIQLPIQCAGVDETSNES